MRSAFQFALARDDVRADVVEISHYPLLARQYAVMAVPKVVINDVLAFEGALPQPDFARAVAEAARRSAGAAGDG